MLAHLLGNFGAMYVTGYVEAKDTSYAVKSTFLSDRLHVHVLNKTSLIMYNVIGQIRILIWSVMPNWNSNLA